MKCCTKKLTTTLAALGAVAYVVCHFWQFAIPEVVRPLHADLLRMSVLGWTGMNLTSLVLGIIQWAIWGWLIAAAFTVFSRHCGKACRSQSAENKGADCCK